MPCYHPLKRFVWNGGVSSKVVSSKFNFLVKDGGNYKPVVSLSGVHGNHDYIDTYSYISCGQCIGCRFDYARSWADRMCIESLAHDHNYFVTLTYRDEHLPRAFTVDSDTGELLDSPFSTLLKREMQLFIKRLRKNTGQKFRYYLAGEYGDQSFRPHYHLIIFGLELNDLVLDRYNDMGQPYYISETIKKAWPYGFHYVADFCWHTAAYVARYVVKKLKGREGQFYKDFGIEPPFVLMSRKPGLARDYYDVHKKDIYTFDGFFLPGCDGRKIKPPRYYDKLYDVEYPEDMERIKELRSLVGDSIQSGISRCTDLSYLDYLSKAEEIVEARVDSLRRNKV